MSNRLLVEAKLVPQVCSHSEIPAVALVSSVA